MKIDMDLDGVLVLVNDIPFWESENGFNLFLGASVRQKFRQSWTKMMNDLYGQKSIAKTFK